MTAINKFNKSMIYTIRSPHTDQYYIGSTSQILCKRFGDHTKHYNRYLKGAYDFISSFKILELGDAYIELLEEVNCDNRTQLHRREGELIREHKANCVNRFIAGRTQKEYYTDNCDRMKQDAKEYRLLNSDKIKQDSKEYYLVNADKIKQYHKEYNLINSDKINEYARNRYGKNKLLSIERGRNRYAENKDKINEQARKRYAEKKLLKDLATITI